MTNAMADTKTINNMELQVGNIVHFHGARFEVLKVNQHSDYVSSKAKWLDGDEVAGYFGRDCDDWNFQGNQLRLVTIEC